MIYTLFDLTDSAGHQVYTKLHIAPANYGFAYSGSIVSADAIILHETGSTAATLLVPNSYDIRLMGKNQQLQFQITLPSSSDGTTQSACNWIVNFVPSDQNTTASYALFAGTASYALSSPGGNTNTASVILWDPGLNRNVVITSYDGILTIT